MPHTTASPTNNSNTNYFKLPPGPFLLFRRHFAKEYQGQKNISLLISNQWKSLSKEERQVWEDRAREVKKTFIFPDNFRLVRKEGTYYHCQGNATLE
jgi:hypothetical protein